MAAMRFRLHEQNPLKRFSEEQRLMVQKRGKIYHKSGPIPLALVSDNRQIAPPWTESLIFAMPTFASGSATEWEGVAQIYERALSRLDKSTQKPSEVYDDNVGFWVALRKLAIQLGAIDQVVSRSDVLLWAIKETVIERAEDVQAGASAIYEAGESAANIVTGAASAIPGIVKALAVGAVGLGVYAVAKRK